MWIQGLQGVESKKEYCIFSMITLIPSIMQLRCLSVLRIAKLR